MTREKKRDSYNYNTYQSTYKTYTFKIKNTGLGWFKREK